MSEYAYPLKAENWWETEKGLTKRELFAAMAMQGMLGNQEQVASFLDDANARKMETGESALTLLSQYIAYQSVAQADALIAELSKPAEGEASND